MTIRSFVSAAVLAVIPFLVSCSDATSPKANLSGQWTYNISNASGSGISCNVTGVTLSLTQSGSTFTGTTSGGLISCSGPGGTASEGLGGDVVANGQVNGNAVQFDISTQDIHNSGTLSGNSISGTVTLRFASGGVTFVLNGNFTAVR